MLTAHVIGHTGCKKCEMLNRRLDALLEKEPYKSSFAKVYHDTEDPRWMKEKELALMFFCKCQCINPNRIPALIITDERGEFLSRDGKPKNSNQLYQFIGIQTDYTDGGGILPPEIIKETLDEAMAAIRG
jgi:hypothetical protein